MLDLWSKALHAWLATATRGLCNDAKERIRDEIEAHFLEALVNLEKQGVPLEEREALALRQLGSPRAARRAYRRQWLTWLEALTYRTFERGIDRTPKMYFGLRADERLRLAIVPAIMIPTVLFFGTGLESLVFGAFYFGLALTTLAGPIGRVVVRRFGEHWAFSVFAGCELLYVLGMAVMVSGLSFVGTPSDPYVQVYVLLGAFTLVLAALQLNTNIRIWRKLYADEQSGGHA